jgi:hypothetical protein
LGYIKTTLETLETTGTQIATVCSSSESIDWTQDALVTAKTVLGTSETTAAMSETMKRMTGIWNVWNARKN